MLYMYICMQFTDYWHLLTKIESALKIIMYSNKNRSASVLQSHKSSPISFMSYSANYEQMGDR